MRKVAPNDWWLQRIENMVGDGIPDVHVTPSSGRDCWVELKHGLRARTGKRFLRSDTTKVRVSQVNWHLKAGQMRLRSFILIRDDSLQLWLFRGFLAERISTMTLEEAESLTLARTWIGVFGVMQNED
jgi:hypothetical protein